MNVEIPINKSVKNDTKKISDSFLLKEDSTAKEQNTSQNMKKPKLIWNGKNVYWEQTKIF